MANNPLNMHTAASCKERRLCVFREWNKQPKLLPQLVVIRAIREYQLCDLGDCLVCPQQRLF